MELKKFKKKETELEKAIRLNYELLNSLEPTSEEYRKVMDNVKELEKLRKPSKDNGELKLRAFEVIGYGVLFVVGMSYERDKVFTFETFKKLRDTNKPRFIK